MVVMQLRQALGIRIEGGMWSIELSWKKLVRLGKGLQCS